MATMFDKMEFAPYSFQEYPKMLFAKGEKTVIVASVGEEEKLLGDWSKSPKCLRAGEGLQAPDQRSRGWACGAAALGANSCKPGRAGLALHRPGVMAKKQTQGYL